MNKIKNTLIMALLVFLVVLALIISLVILGIIVSFIIGTVSEFVVGDAMGGIKMVLLIGALGAMFYYELHVS